MTDQTQNESITYNVYYNSAKHSQSSLVSGSVVLSHKNGMIVEAGTTNAVIEAKDRPKSSMSTLKSFGSLRSFSGKNGGQIQCDKPKTETGQFVKTVTVRMINNSNDVLLLELPSVSLRTKNVDGNSHVSVMIPPTLGSTPFEKVIRVDAEPDSYKSFKSRFPKYDFNNLDSGVDHIPALNAYAMKQTQGANHPVLGVLASMVKEQFQDVSTGKWHCGADVYDEKIVPVEEVTQQSLKAKGYTHLINETSWRTALQCTKNSLINNSSASDVTGETFHVNVAKAGGHYSDQYASAFTPADKVALTGTIQIDYVSVKTPSTDSNGTTSSTSTTSTTVSSTPETTSLQSTSTPISNPGMSKDKKKKHMRRGSASSSDDDDESMGYDKKMDNTKRPKGKGMATDAEDYEDWDEDGEKFLQVTDKDRKTLTNL